MSIAVAIATYGSEEFWNPLAARAVASVINQTRQADKISYVHGENLHEARNDAIRATDTTHVVVLDADDELHPDYLAHMEDADGDVRIPAVQLYYDAPPRRRVLDPFVIRAGQSLKNRNHVPIGAMFSREAFEAAGGFEDYPIFEDWALWCRMWLAGFQNFQTVEKAIYKAHQRFGSRNSQHQYAAGMVRVIQKIFEESEQNEASKVLGASNKN